MNPGTAALARGLDVLSLLAEPEASRSGLGVVSLADRLGADKSQLSRTLQTLRERGFVERDPDSLAYRLGPAVLALAARAADDRLLAEARPVLRDLVRRLGESVHLSVRSGSQVLTLLSESPAAAIHAPGRIGGLTPLATTSAGRVLALDLEPEELQALGAGAAARAIAEARRCGYAIVREEFEPGLVAAAAPIRDHSGRVVAALNVSAPSFRFDAELDAAALVVAGAARSLSSRLAGGPARAAAYGRTSGL